MDVRHLESEAFGDLLESILRRVIMTRSEQKRVRFRQVLLREILAPRATDLQELFLDLIAELEEQEVEMLREYRAAAEIAAQRSEEDSQVPLAGAFRTAEHFGMDEAAYQIARDHLGARGLLFDDGMGRWDASARQFYEITELGLAFLRFIELPDSPRGTE